MATTCSGCGSTRVYPSRLRNAFERIREAITGDLSTGRDAAPVKPNELDELDPIRVRR